MANPKKNERRRVPPRVAGRPARSGSSGQRDTGIDSTAGYWSAESWSGGSGSSCDGGTSSSSSYDSGSSGSDSGCSSF